MTRQLSQYVNIKIFVDIFMSLLAIKKKIISSRLGIFLDEKVRCFLSLIPSFHSIFFSSKKEIEPDCFVFFLYGGYGDVILQFPLIQNISKNQNVVIFCEKKVLNLNFLLPDSVKLIAYSKNTIISKRKELRREIRGYCTVLIQTSPIIEVYFIKALLGIRYSLGLISSYREIKSIGFRFKPKKIDSLSKLDVFNDIYQVTSRLFFKLPPNRENNFYNYQNKENFKVNVKYKYIVISAMKTIQWKMGKMPICDYAQLADYFWSEHEFKVFFVGDALENPLIEEIISLTKHKESMKNMAGSTNFKELSSILSGAEFVIANDNGVAHLSAFLNLKTLVLFMFSDPKIYKWNSDNYAYIFNKNFKCMPCVGPNQNPTDNYPTLCKINYLCNSTISHNTIENKLKSLEWI
jgi:ADP-heptose:LPS heptosyltransferase